MNILIRGFYGWLLSSLKRDPNFVKFVKSVCKEFYCNESLMQLRIWGDPSRLTIGQNVQLNDSIINTVSGIVSIGDHTFLGHGVSLLTGTHDYKKTNMDRQISVPSSGRDITIGCGVWIASNATIIGPCSIGDHSVIGAGSVVTGVVPSGTLFGGVPAKFVKNLNIQNI